MQLGLEGGELAEHTREDVVRRQDGHARVEGALLLTEPRARHAHDAGGLHELETPRLVRSPPLLRAVGDELCRQREAGESVPVSSVSGVSRVSRVITAIR